MREFRQKLRNLRNSSRKTSAAGNVGSAATSGTAVSGALDSHQLAPTTDQQVSSSAAENTSLSNENTISIQSQVWNEAYDDLKDDEPGIVDAYERILSSQITSGVSATEVEGYPENDLGTTAARRDKLTKLIEDGQSKTERVSNMKEKINDVMQPFNQLRSVISLAVKTDPTASTAWAGITALLDILAFPLSEPGANREGMKYILERAEWYWVLSALLLDANKIDQTLAELQTKLKKSIVKLYKKLLLYQMKSVCLYSRSQVAVILRDVVKLDDWKAQITSIEKAAESVRFNVSQFRAEEISARLRSLDKCLKGVRTDLQAITIAVQDLDSEQRKRHDKDKDTAFLNQLYDVDPRLEKAAIEDLKGGLVKEAHDLVLEQSNFEQLQKEDDEGIVWITGGPGRGKTMFLCGIIDRLLQRRQYDVVTYFFCRADRQKARTAKAVLRGLLWLICGQSWGVTRRLREEYENQSNKLFEDDDAMVSVALEKMMDKVLSAPSMRGAILIVDAIDECDNISIPILLRTIGRLSRDCPAQWILSTRTSANYRSLLSNPALGITPTYLELSDDVISRAVQAYVKYKIDELSMVKGYSADLQKNVHAMLSSKAGDTFLWVALVCLELQGLGIEPRHVANILNTIPQGLNDLYQRMFTGAMASVDGHLCKEILPLVSIASRPLTLDELRALVPGVENLSDAELRGVVANCGSFLSVQGENASSAIVAFIHESAREYLTDAAQTLAFPAGILHRHRLIFRQALSSIKELTRNIYDLPFPGTTIDEVEKPVPDPLSRLRYSCHHWFDHADHLQQNQDWQASDDKAIESFVCNDLLHWVEVLSLTASMPEGTAAFQRLSRFYRTSSRSESQGAAKLTEDARHFIINNKPCIEIAPLQVYSSAILFGLQGSSTEIKHHYQHELDWVTLNPQAYGATWSQFCQELPSDKLSSYMSFSPNGRFLVTANYQNIRNPNSPEHSIEMWDLLASHRILSVLLNDLIVGVNFSLDGKEVLVVLEDGTVKRLDAESGRCVGNVNCPSSVRKTFFSPNKQYLALETRGGTLMILHIETGKVIQTINAVVKLSFSPDSLQMVTWLGKTTVAFWHIGNSNPVWVDSIKVQDLTFFGSQKVAVLCRQGITVRAATDGSEICIFPCHPKARSITWLGTGLGYLCRCYDTINIYDDTGISCVQSLPCGSGCYDFSAATHSFAWKGNPAIRVWDLNMRASPEAFDQPASNTQLKPISRITFSPSRNNDALLAINSGPGVEIWSLCHGKVSKNHKLACPFPEELAFSPDGAYLVTLSFRGLFQVWDTAGGTTSGQQRFLGPNRGLCFSPDAKSLVLPRGTDGVLLWDFAAQDVAETIPVAAEKAVYSHDGRLLATAYRGCVQIWSISPLQCLHELDLDFEPLEKISVRLISFSPDNESLAIAVNDFVFIWYVHDTKPRHRFSWVSTEDYWGGCLALSPDGKFVAATNDYNVWIWHLTPPITSQPMCIELPHKTKKCRFDANSKHLIVDGGAVSFVDGDQRQMEYFGYGLSEDCEWITKDNRKILYLTQEFRPGDRPKNSGSSRVAFMDSTVALGTDYGRLHILRFCDESSWADRRWARSTKQERVPRNFTLL